MKRLLATAFIIACVAILSGCGTINKNAYHYNPGQPSYSTRLGTWEGFGAPAKTENGIRALPDYSSMTNNPRVLWVIADTYGNAKDLDQGWLTAQPWFFDPVRVRFIEPDGTPDDAPHWHGIGCYSRGWPLLYKMPNIDYVLFRMIDVPYGEDLLLDFLDAELPKYNGRVILSNSWGIPRQANGNQPLYEALWKPWVNRLDKMANDYSAFTVVFSAGNSGPDFSGVPQCILTNALMVGATDQAGYIAEFSSQDTRMFCVAGGDRTYVANDQKAGEYMIVSGTSFSCPTVAAMVVKLLAENPTWNRKDAVTFLESQIVPSPNAKGFNTVWGWGELEQFNQKVPHEVWRELGFPKGFRAMVRNWVTRDRIIDLPQPLGPSK